jgi:hypothetical protein
MTVHLMGFAEYFAVGRIYTEHLMGIAEHLAFAMV